MNRKGMITSVRTADKLALFFSISLCVLFYTSNTLLTQLIKTETKYPRPPNNKIKLLHANYTAELAKTLKTWFGNNTKFPSTATSDFTINPSDLCKSERPIDFLVLVHTKEDHFELRKGIRMTFGDRQAYRSLNHRVAFLIGETPNLLVTKKIREEAAKYKDIVQGQFHDTYRNLTLKGVMGLRWTALHCSHARVIIKIDDDTFLNMYQITRDIFPEARNKSLHFWCQNHPVNQKEIFRSMSKWSVAKTDFRNLTHYPVSHCAGYFVVLTTDLIQSMLEAARFTPFFWIDDVYLFGLLPYSLSNVTYTNVKKRSVLHYKGGHDCLRKDGVVCNYFAFSRKIGGELRSDQMDATYFTNLWKAMKDGVKSHVDFLS